MTVASDIIYERDIGVTLDIQIDETEKFIMQTITIRTEIIGTKRVKTPEYIRKAIRELVASAIIYKEFLR